MKPIRILDPDFKILTEIDRYSSFQRTSKWHEPGEFEFHVNLHMQGTEYLQKDNMIVTLEEETVETSIDREEDLSEGIHHNVEVT